MKIAVLGAGFAGLAVTYHLTVLSNGRFSIDLFDPEPIGQGPSATALGLLHPYMGRKAQRSWQADRCLKRAHELIGVAASSINEPVVLSKGIVRPTTRADQLELFKARAQESDQLEFWTREASQATIPGLQLPPESGCLFVKEGWTINVPIYLQGLFRACVTHGVVFKQLRGVDAKMVEKYDAFVVCLGANSLGFGPFKALPMIPIKGQVLKLEWPKNLPPLPMSLVGDKQIVMSKDYENCWVGATYEREFQDFQPHQEETWKALMPTVLDFLPALENAKILECRVGFRASPKNRYPLAGKHGKFWFLTGLGSRGLLYHAWLGRRLALCILRDKLDFIPSEVLYELPPQQQS